MRGLSMYARSFENPGQYSTNSPESANGAHAARPTRTRLKTGKGRNATPTKRDRSKKVKYGAAAGYGSVT
ncbi:BcepNY3gp58 [Burkholderia phage BcepNY3]|uniref:Gp59 n=4 Tax=Naesvirus TaxID=2733115 RepID=Q53Z31_9CAUD|nr:BcepNY3gp58 [Burkholderia phage BcepNY3]YP_022514.1 gp59 [Burkholderia phage Bcep1]YP_022747.1 gp57 [Burkholderia phage Bcep781]YP_022749.1 gp56 [Burkholderia phage Bcep43]AAT37989.1 gp57 [Burkholderia phage Bcep781]AAT37991.1 gp56 [Burkholderia phage Bcep43]AAT37993.1 gp59 [Burkholderia phage Bcep1]ABR10593.1 BcepNY3gp58 [Burkholderia phage BcepNY3]